MRSINQQRLYSRRGGDAIEIEIEAVTKKLLATFDKNLDIFLKDGFSPFLQKYKRRLIHSPNQPIRFRDYKKIWEGKFHSINDDGSLSLELKSGEIKNFTAGDIC